MKYFASSKYFTGSRLLLQILIMQNCFPINFRSISKKLLRIIDNIHILLKKF